MGRSQFLRSRGVAIATLFVAAFLFAACGEPESLLVPEDSDEIFGEGGGGFGMTSSDPATFGAIKGRVVFEGKPYKAKTFTLSDKFCITASPNGLKSEEFLYDADTKGIQGAMVYIQSGIKSFGDVPSEPVVLDQINCEYVPHLAVLRTGQQLIIKSSDATLHNVAGNAAANGDKFNYTMNAPMSLAPKVWNRPELDKPVKLKCDVHGWMSAFVAVLPHPFAAITAKDGSFELKGVPPGKYRLLIWHEMLGERKVEVTLTANQELVVPATESTFTR